MNPTRTPSGAFVDLLRGDGLHVVYQPIVHLASGEVVAHEALLRGPDGSALASPGALFATAARDGLTEELEDRAVELAIDGALAAGLGRDTALFINVEGDQVARVRDQLTDGDFDHALTDLRVVIEVTERNLMARPGELLALGEELRAVGWGLAIDDVGAEHVEGVAALPFVRPDVVKLDMVLAQEAPTMSGVTAEIALAVRQHVEHFGGSVLAEGIEDQAHLARAVVLGADLGQGWLFGRGGPCPTASDVALRHPVGILDGFDGMASRVPSAIAGDRLPFAVANKRDLLAMSRTFEARALREAPHVAVFGLMQDVGNYTPRTRWRYESLGDVGALVSIFGTGMSDLETAGVRTVEVSEDHPLRDEWSVVMWGVGHHGALVARDLGDTGVPDMERRFTFAITHDAALVIDIGRSLMNHLPSRRR